MWYVSGNRDERAIDNPDMPLLLTVKVKKTIYRLVLVCIVVWVIV